MNQPQIHPYVRLARNDTESRGWSVSRSIWDYEIIYIVDGEMMIEIGGKKYIAKKDAIIFIRPKTPHTLTVVSKTVNQPHIHFDLYQDELSDKIPVSFLNIEEMDNKQKTLFRNDDLKALSLNFPIIMYLHNHEEIKKVLFTIIDEYCFKSEMHDLYILSLIEQMLVLMSRGYSVLRLPNSKNKSLMIENIKSYILDNFERNPSVEEMANYCGLSKYYFLKIFKSYYGVTPHVFIDELRFNRSKEYLRYYDQISITRIAELLNFKSVIAFCSWFKNRSDISPNQYRKALQKQD